MAKGTRVTQPEKEKMWRLYQEGRTFKAIAKKMGRCPDTVSRYVHEYEVAVSTATVILNAQKT